MLTLERKVPFPLYISVNLLFFSPEEVTLINADTDGEESEDNQPAEMGGEAARRAGERDDEDHVLH